MSGACSEIRGWECCLRSLWLSCITHICRTHCLNPLQEYPELACVTCLESHSSVQELLWGQPVRVSCGTAARAKGPRAAHDAAAAARDGCVSTPLCGLSGRTHASLTRLQSLAADTLARAAAAVLVYTYSRA